jgi:CTP:molybdopterin cytidylyltransferase MocA
MIPKPLDIKNNYCIINNFEKNNSSDERAVFIDKVTDMDSFEKAMFLAKDINNDYIYMGSLKDGEVYRYNKPDAVIMASGFSRRMGENKLFMEFLGEPMLERIVKLLSSLPFHEITLVGRENKSEALGEKYRVRYVHNRDASLGQSESMRLGVLKSSGEGIGFFPADQPLLTREVVLRLLWEFQKKNIITLPVINGRRNSPVFFPNSSKKELIKIKGDTGGKNIIKRTEILNEIVFESSLYFEDIDSYEKLEEIYEKMQSCN